MSTFRAAALLVVIASVSTAFTTTVGSRRARLSSSSSSSFVLTTPTTLFYRDDMNPREYSSTKWQIPNDFDQFLTQCSIQSLMVLLHSLRDDPTLVWLHEFTDPVMRVNVTTTATTTATSSTTVEQESGKVSLDRAVQAALDEPAHMLKPFQTKKNNNKQSKIKTRTSSTATATAKTIVKPMTPRRVKKAKKSLRKKRPLAKTAFATFSQRATSLSAAFMLCDPDDEECNTDIDALYSNSHMFAKVNRDTNSNNGDTDQPQTSSYDMSALYSRSPMMIRRENANRKQAWRPKSNDNSRKRAITSCTNALYAAPESPPPADSQDSSTINSSSQASSSPSPHYKLWKYHGLATLNATKFPTSLNYFEQLLVQPKQTWTIVQKQSTANKRVSYVAPTYELDIDPASLCSRLLSVRNQIALEFQHDLGILATMGADTLKSYWTMREDQRKQQHQEKREESKSPEEKKHEEQLRQHGKHYQGDLKDNTKIPKSKLVLQRPNLLFLDQAPPTSDNPDYTPSPCRKGNFDLLQLMSTQEAIHRVLNDPQRQARKSAEHGSNQFLQDFYVARLWSHFSGDQPYGRADDFLEELLECSPRLVTVGGGDGDSVRNAKDVADQDVNRDSNDGADGLTKDLTYLIDPLGIAETILNQREKVALEWQVQVADQTKLDHMKIQRLVLAKMMESSTVKDRLVEGPPEIELAFTARGSTNQTESIFE